MTVSVQIDFVDRTTTPRLPWHDIAVSQSIPNSFTNEFGNAINSKTKSKLNNSSTGE